MNKKEISEIKKQLTPENCALTRLCACYVDGEKNKKKMCIRDRLYAVIELSESLRDGRRKSANISEEGG